MSRHTVKAEQQASWRIILTLLCVLLVLVCGTIQAVHVHPAGDLSHSDCALCATAHLAVQIVQPAVSLFVAPVVVVVETPPVLVRSTIFSTFALFTRPPPVDVVSA